MFYLHKSTFLETFWLKKLSSQVHLEYFNGIWTLDVFFFFSVPRFSTRVTNGWHLILSPAVETKTKDPAVVKCILTEPEWFGFIRLIYTRFFFTVTFLGNFNQSGDNSIVSTGDKRSTLYSTLNGSLKNATMSSDTDWMRHICFTLFV